MYSIKYLYVHFCKNHLTTGLFTKHRVTEFVQRAKSIEETNLFSFLLCIKVYERTGLEISEA